MDKNLGKRIGSAGSAVALGKAGSAIAAGKIGASIGSVKSASQAVSKSTPKLNVTGAKPSSSKSSNQKGVNPEYIFLRQQGDLINRQFGEAQNIYDRQAAELTQLQPFYEQSIIRGYESQKPILQQQFQTGMENIGLQKEQTKGQRESALAQARRQYEEGLQKSQTLFGGVAGSSAGQASAEILGAEQLRQMGSAQTQSAQNLMTLGTAERDLRGQLTTQLQQLEVKKQQDLMKLRDSFRQELNQINQQKGALSQNKANAQLQALQDYNNRRRQLDDLVTEQRMNLESFAQQAAIQFKYNQMSNAQSQAVAPLPNLRSLNDQDRARNILTLRNSQPGLNALAQAGFDLQDVAGRTVLYNQTTGETYDLAGRRYADFAPTIYSQQSKDSVLPLEQITGPQR
jgi:hypothetical protein